MNRRTFIYKAVGLLASLALAPKLVGAVFDEPELDCIKPENREISYLPTAELTQEMLDGFYMKLISEGTGDLHPWTAIQALP